MAETKICKKQAGDGFWTADNLLAGTNISITQVPHPVIDEHTVELLHLNDNTNDEISNTDVYSSGGTLSYSDGKFGKCLSVSGSQSTFTNRTNFKPGRDSYTIDYWFRGNSSISYPYPGVQLESTTTNGQIYFTSTTSMTIGSELTGAGSAKTFTIPSIASQWVHIAYVHNLGDKDYLFLNGSLLESWTRTYNYNGVGFLGILVGSTVDEVRVSNVARWTSDFTPFTQPYSTSAGPAQYAINNTKADPDLSSYLQNTATATNSLTINGVANTASATSVNIGDNSQAGGGQCVAIGSGSTTSNSAYANTNCVAIGFASRANYSSGTAIGRETETTGNNGVAVGYESVATTNAVAIGKTAKATAQSSIQIGTGTNSTASTFQVFNTTVVNASGKIPAANLDTTIPDVTTKADTDLGNVSTTSGFRRLVEVYNNGTSWYKVFDEYDPNTGDFIGKWCEQGGRDATSDLNPTISLLKSMTNTDYSVEISVLSTTSSEYMGHAIQSINSASSFVIRKYSTGWVVIWRVCGYIS